MKSLYYGTKAVLASAMTRADYNAYRGWKLPEDEAGGDDGYLVEYVNGGVRNHANHEGYISWSPVDIFDAAYQPADAMSFGHALAAMKAGDKVARAGWNGKGMHVCAVNPDTTASPYGWHFYIKQVDGGLSTWVPSCGDCFADDWQLVRDFGTPEQVPEQLPFPFVH